MRMFREMHPFQISTSSILIPYRHLLLFQLIPLHGVAPIALRHLQSLSLCIDPYLPLCVYFPH